MRTLIAILLMTGAVQAQECQEGERSDVLALQSWSASEDNFGTEITMALENRTDRGIRMIKGSVRYYDAFDDHIASLKIDPDVELPADGSITQSGIYNVERLRTIHPDDVKAIVCLQGVVYDDGTVDEYVE